MKTIQNVVLKNDTCTASHIKQAATCAEAAVHRVASLHGQQHRNIRAPPSPHSSWSGDSLNF